MKRSAERLGCLRLIVCLVAGTVLLSFCVQQKQTAGKRSPMNVAMQRAIGICKAIRFWSLDSDGKSPVSLRDTSFVEGLGLPLEDQLYRDPETGRLLDWLYFPRDMGGPADQIIIASPIAYKGQRVVVFTDCSGKIMKSEEFEAIYPRVQLD